jgi:hypothetical protein
VVGRYQFPSWTSGATDDPGLNVAGLQFGLKLPTGSFDVKNSEGEPAERSLQPGTGTTDLVLGAYFRQSFPVRQVSWFGQAQLQQALNFREGYRPGIQVALNLGLRYDATDHIGLMLQLNTLWKGRDSGSEAEPENSGGTFVFLSPGISYTIGKNAQLYAFYQQSLYQYVNGVQLTANWAAVGGVSVRF